MGSVAQTAFATPAHSVGVDLYPRLAALDG
jgi:hypothetical protein